MSKSYDEKKAYATNYIKALREIEDLMEPLKESKRDLRDEYHEQDWLSRPEMASVVRAYRLVQQSNKGNICLDELFEHVSMFNELVIREANLKIVNSVKTGVDKNNTEA